MADVYVAAGSNIDPLRSLDRALGLAADRWRGLRVSPAYRNAAVGFAGDEFVNLVFGFATDEPVEAVVTALRDVEAACGRPADAPKWAPRVMDLDILLYGAALRSAAPVLPRPDLVRRAYMLRPMAELAPHVVHPTLGRTMADLWRDFPQAGHAMTLVAGALAARS